jgi:hypothetical protein
MNLDEILNAIEGLRSDPEAAYTALMSAAATCMNVMLDQAEPELRERLEVSEAAGFRVMIWHEPCLDLLVDDRFMRVAELRLRAGPRAASRRQ